MSHQQWMKTLISGLRPIRERHNGLQTMQTLGRDSGREHHADTPQPSASTRVHSSVLRPVFRYSELDLTFVLLLTVSSIHEHLQT